MLILLALREAYLRDFWLRDYDIVPYFLSYYAQFNLLFLFALLYTRAKFLELLIIIEKLPNLAFYLFLKS
jgi:hypothetical protein